MHLVRLQGQTPALGLTSASLLCCNTCVNLNTFCGADTLQGVAYGRSTGRQRWSLQVTGNRKLLPSQRIEPGSGMRMWDCTEHLSLAAVIHRSYAGMRIAGHIMGVMAVQVQ